MLTFQIATATVLGENLRRAEEAHTRQVASGVLSAFKLTTFQFSDQFTDWAASDNTYLFVQHRNDEFIASNLSALSIAARRVNLLMFLRLDGTPVQGERI